MEFVVRCKECGALAKINDASVKRVDVVVIENGSHLRLLYYTCSECKEMHIVQLDNVKTREVLNEIKNKMRTVMISKAKGFEPKKKDVNRLNKKRRELIRLRRELVSDNEFLHYNLNGECREIVVEMQEEVEQDARYE